MDTKTFLITFCFLLLFLIFTTLFRAIVRRDKKFLVSNLILDTIFFILESVLLIIAFHDDKTSDNPTEYMIFVLPFCFVWFPLIFIKLKEKFLKKVLKMELSYYYFLQELLWYVLGVISMTMAFSGIGLLLQWFV